MKSFEVIHHQRTIRIYREEEPFDIRFDADAWERLINELNNPPDLGVEVADAVATKEEIAGS
jgi:hypothetical protein